VATAADIDAATSGISDTYATKSELNATSENITSTVASTYVTIDDAANTYVTSSTFEQTANGFTASIKTAQDTADLAQTTANSATTTASSAATTASAAQTTANSKRRVFTSTPTPPYDVGDLWSQGTSGELMVCKTAKSSGSYTASNWQKASKYTDDTTATAAATAASNAAKTATNYLSFSTAGLVVGDQTGSTLGGNVLIDSDSVDIRNGTEVLSSFDATGVVFSDHSYIKHEADDANSTRRVSRTTISEMSNADLVSSELVLTAGYLTQDDARADIKINAPAQAMGAEGASISINAPGGLYINSNLLSDYIVACNIATAQSTWSWVKYNSGIAVCWLYTANTTSINEAWGGGYISEPLSWGQSSFPFTFTSIQTILYGILNQTASSLAQVMPAGMTSLSACPTVFRLGRYASSSAENYWKTGMVAIGRWK
jgi:hypothetical protein